MVLRDYLSQRPLCCRVLTGRLQGKKAGKLILKAVAAGMAVFTKILSFTAPKLVVKTVRSFTQNGDPLNDRFQGYPPQAIERSVELGLIVWF